MPLKLASKTQVSGHFFVRRRLSFALLRRSVGMEINPVRWHRTLLMLSAVLGVVLVVGAFVYGWFRPAGVIDDASKIVADSSSGALFVVVDKRLYPALNLVSAQLIADSPERPTFVAPTEIAKWPKGPTVGIQGAPVETPAVLSPQISRWAVCDTAPTTVGGSPLVTGIDGQLSLGEAAGELAGSEALLLSYGPQVYLVTNGVRMPIDLSASAVAGPLGIAPGAQVMGMSRALFDALPAGGPLVVPAVPGAGGPGQVDLGAGVVVGAVVASRDVAAQSDRFYVVLADGVQEVSPVVASMLRQHDSFGLATPPQVSPDHLAHIPLRHVLDVDYYPRTPVHLVDAASRPVSCVAWQWSVSERQARLAVVSGRGLPIRSDQRAKVVPLVGAGNGGVQANQVLVGDRASTFVSTTGQALDSPARETMWLISSTGSRYGVPFDENSVQALGLVLSQVRPAPWSMLQVWPAGPELSRAAALTVHSPSDAVAVLPTKTNVRAGG
ncbi:type VII secretion protein EccB [Mycobacterium sp. SMC-2]|uniref:type VII secretion protein EccB n=1 Tax=Mycobacterium TaxID=1763 RepID=UPI001CE11394|nr:MULTISPECIES: type VII secretion protein EccB [Mycobacterium]MCA4761693.1 type VII secretion protein EccB [Mycobacterium avium subsp. hominissuis]UXA06510.1 type VII secretion protein EccB [Mycobacterium sp. SMC-2]